jgi:ssDNA-specific exonuclease RecJ
MYSMNRNASGSLSGSKAATYHENKEGAKIQPDLTFLTTNPTRGQLMKQYEILAYEDARKEQKIQSLLEELHKLRKENIAFMNDAIFYQKAAVDLGQVIIENIPGHNPYLSLVG